MGPQPISTYCRFKTRIPRSYLSDLFTGKERDTESGNDYFDARYYSSAMGRFISPDWSAQVEPVPYAKLGNPQSLNLYAYVQNNPMGGVDDDGHDTGGDGSQGNNNWLQGDITNARQAVAAADGIMGDAIGQSLSASEGGGAQQQGSKTSKGPFIAKDPQKYMGTCVGRGECVDFVKADTDVPRTTKDWAPGAKVDKDTPQGAAIATFGPDGKYQNSPGQSHAAELVSVAPNGKSAVIRDQYHTSGGQQDVHTRTILDRGGHGLPVNDLSRYSVIMRRDDQ
jgi:RHS repeat-associated protein